MVNTNKLFFLTGMGKSGTGWVMHMLNKKPEIICRGEGRFFSSSIDGSLSLQQIIEKGIRPWYDFTARRKLNWINLDDEIRTINKKNFINKDVFNSNFNRDIRNISRLVIRYFMTKVDDEEIKLVGDKSTIRGKEEFRMMQNVFPSSKVLVMKRDLKELLVSRVLTWWEQCKKNPFDICLTKRLFFTEEDYVMTDDFFHGKSDSIVTEESAKKFIKAYKTLYDCIEKESKKNPYLIKIISFAKITNSPVNTMFEIFNFLDVVYSKQEVIEIVESSQKGKIEALKTNISKTKKENECCFSKKIIAEICNNG